MTKLKIFSGIFGLLFLLSPLATLAVGQTTEPIVVNNAMRGEEVEQKMILINTDNAQMKVDLTARGDIQDWVKFFSPDDLANPVGSISIPADKPTANLVAVFTVPEDAPNGEYTGFIGVAKGFTGEEKTEGSSVNISQQVDRSVKIVVTDQEMIKLAVSVIPAKYDLAAGEALSVRLIYDNQSNVSLKPQVEFKIKQGEKTVYNSVFPYPEAEAAVRPSSQHEIPALEIATSALSKGKYTAELNFLHHNEKILTEDFTFSVGSGSVLGAMDTGLRNLILTIGLAIIVVVLIVIAALFFKRNGRQRTAPDWPVVKSNRPLKSKASTINRRKSQKYEESV